MFLKSYIPSRYNTFFAVLALLLWIFTSFKYLLVFLLCYVAVYVLLRREVNYYRDEPAIQNDGIFAPCNGKITNINYGTSHSFFGDNLTEIQILLPWWREMGIFMPQSLEVKDLRIFPGKSFLRFKNLTTNHKKDVQHKSLGILFQFSQLEIGMEFVKCPLGLWPEIVVMPGDRGSKKVNIGFFPLGGTVLLYIPSGFEVLTGLNENIDSKKTLVAIRHEEKIVID